MDIFQSHFQNYTKMSHIKTARAVYYKLLLKLQKMNNTSVISIQLQFVKFKLGHFTNQAQGDSRT